MLIIKMCSSQDEFLKEQGRYGSVEKNILKLIKMKTGDEND